MERETPHVLLVDDNCDVVETLGCVLELDGLRVARACDGASALAHVRRARPDVVILDLLLPDIDGYALAQATRAEVDGDKTFLIAYTGDATEAARLRCASAGIDAYVLKPADPGQLRDLILRAVGSAVPSGRPARLWSGGGAEGR